MTKKSRRLLYVFLGCCIALFWLYYAHVNVVMQIYQGRAWSIERLITDFIRENGHFPYSQQELIDGGYLKIEYENNQPKYFKKIKGVEGWKKWPVYLEWFKILYGVKKENIYMLDNALYEKTKHRRIFLLDGPYNRRIPPSLQSTYNLISLKWYKEMENVSAREEDK